MRVLVADPLAEEGLERLRLSHQVDVRTGLTQQELIEAIPPYHALLVRSESKVTAEVINAATELRVVGRAGVGIDNIDVGAATARGIVVVNSPEGNTIAATEHTLALILALARNVPQAASSLARGEWERSRFTGIELYHKTLGILGFGKIGREVARRALSFEMRVIATDPFVLPDQAQRMGVRMVDRDALFRESDFLTVHLPLTAATRGSVGDREFDLVRPGFRVVNCARGGIVDESALLKALEDGRVAGAALDVFSNEPPPAGHPLLAHPNVVSTPHLGASTREAQVSVAADVADQVMDVLRGRPARSAVNMPAISPEQLSRVSPFLDLASRMGTLMAALIEGPIRAAHVTYTGEVASLGAGPVTRSFLTGLLQPVLEDRVNLVNAMVIAEQRGVAVTESVETAPASGLPYSSLVTARVTGDGEPRTVSGAVVGREARIVSIDGYRVELVPEGVMLITTHTDQPGMIGHVGSLLGRHQVNIAGMHLGRAAPRGRAVMVLNIDEALTPDLLKELTAIEGMRSTTVVEFDSAVAEKD